MPLDLRPGLVVWDKVNQRVVTLKKTLRYDSRVVWWSIEGDAYAFEYPSDWFEKVPDSVTQLISEVERLKIVQINSHNVGLFNEIKGIRQRAREIQSNAKCTSRMSAYIDYIIDGKEVDERKLYEEEAERGRIYD